jgi:hypothetical protein
VSAVYQGRVKPGSNFKGTPPNVPFEKNAKENSRAFFCTDFQPISADFWISLQFINHLIDKLDQYLIDNLN